MINLKSALIAIGLILGSTAAIAQSTAPSPVAVAPAPIAAAPAAAATTATPVAAAKASETSIGTSKPVAGIGQPVSGGFGIQPQVTKLGEQALWIHQAILMPLITVISLFVLLLLFWVVAKYRRSANPVPSKTSHNTFIEIVWTLVPVLILAGVAIPSISLLAAQYKPAPANSVVIKAIGNQWYWSYEYPDNGVELTANMLTDEQAIAKGEPENLAVDQRVVIPVNTPIKVITTASDVIHSWAIPAFWIKMDAIPGRLNEVTFTVEKEGVYYGQCSQLCGDRHSFMPIGVEVVSKEKFAEWIHAKGGKMPGDKVAEAAASPVTTPVVAKN